MPAGLTRTEINKLFFDLGEIKQQNTDQEAKIDTLFGKVDDLSTKGCAVGTANADRISRIEERPMPSISTIEERPMPSVRKLNGKNTPVITVGISAAGVTAIVTAGVLAWLKFKGG